MQSLRFARVAAKHLLQFLGRNTVKTITTFGIAAALLPGAAGIASADIDQNQIFIDKVAYNGTGCAPGTAEVALSDDHQAVTVMYSEFVAEVGPGIPLSASRKNCQLNINVHVPGGITFAIAEVDYRGFADIAAGAQGIQ